MRTLRGRLAFTFSLFLLLILPAIAQENSWQGSEKGPQLKAQLADKDKNAARRIAVVEVDVRNITLTDPTGFSGSSGMGHLQFRVDQGPYIVPLNNRLILEGLTPGKHTISVSLADSSFRGLGAKADLEVVIP
jgi:hypothetical protein